jgi:hypothetical protein
MQTRPDAFCRFDVVFTFTTGPFISRTEGVSHTSLFQFAAVQPSIPRMTRRVALANGSTLVRRRLGLRAYPVVLAWLQCLVHGTKHAPHSKPVDVVESLVRQILCSHEHYERSRKPPTTAELLCMWYNTPAQHQTMPSWCSSLGRTICLRKILW